MNKMKIKEILVYIIIIILFGVVYFSLLVPSYLSYLASCNTEKFEEKYGDDFRIMGSTTYTPTQEGDGQIIEEEIIVEVEDEEDYPVLMHEMCHVNQIKRGFPSLYCDDFIQVYISELECYSIQRFYEAKELVQVLLQ